jgi:5-methylcytosine-specific restriction endonuclease McrA
VSKTLRRRARDAAYARGRDLGIYLPDAVLPFVTSRYVEGRRLAGTERTEKVYPGRDGSPYRVHMDSLRYQIFARPDGLKCAYCGIVGEIFVLEKPEDPTCPEDRAHFNLYAMVKLPDNDPRVWQRVLMTKDHVVPKSKGGKDHLGNLRTCCSPCNTEKADSMECSNPLAYGGGEP